MLRAVGIVVNQDKPNVFQVTQQLINLLEQRSVKVYVEEEFAHVLSRHDLASSLSAFPTRVDVVFVMGGDGTLLGAARTLAPHSLPILGINMGYLGFLSEAEPENLSAAVDRIIEGDYCIEKRLMLQIDLFREGKVIEQGIALNDVGIAKGSFGRMITCHVSMDQMYIGTYSGDGMIVSSPTGSTAYSLSCGGPMVYPSIQAVLLTPICSHTLTSRPMVLPAQSVLEIQVSASHPEMDVTLDGQVVYHLKENDIIQIQKSRYSTKLIKWKERSFFEVARKKLLGTENMQGGDKSAKRTSDP